MFWQLTRFEIFYLLKKPITWIGIVAFLLMGFAMGSMRNLPFAGICRNAPYLVAYFTGVATLGTIFTITISVAQSFLKDRVANFEAILFTTPIKKIQYLGAQLSGVFLVVLISFSFAMVGLIAGQYMPWLPASELQGFNLLNYCWPLLILGVPNILFCIVVTGSIALLSKSSIGVYTGGLLIYVCYIAGSIISNSPLIATASPATPEAMSLVARLDPFGLAAFFEQTRYWTIAERNSQLISLKDEFLFNRVLYLSVALVIGALTYLKFSFRQPGTVNKPSTLIPTAGKTIQPFTSPELKLHSNNWRLQSAWSLIKLDLQLVVKGIPFVVILILLTALLVLDLTNEIDAGVRNAARYADTELMVTGILSNLPLFGSLVILFYSNELLWNLHTNRMAGIGTTNPVTDSIFYFSKLAVLAIIVLFMLGWAILLGIIVQFAYDYPVIERFVYASLLYYLALPLLLLSMLLVLVQNFTTSKYLGLVLSALVTLFFNSRIGAAMGIHHPLLRFANTPDIPFLKMNGFGEYRIGFNWQMINELSLSILCGLLTIISWNRNHENSFMQRFSFNRLRQHFKIPAVALFVFLITSGFIYYQASIKNPTQSRKEKFDWRENYERSFKKYERLPQPAVILVKAAVDLFPGEHRYEVRGAYVLVNKNQVAIDSLLLYFDPNMQLQELSVPGATLVLIDNRFHHRLFVLKKMLLPGDTLTINFRFNSSWSPFAQHTPFNSIIGNGSFIRMSRYFPLFGYQEGNEIDLPAERKRRGLPDAPALRSVDAQEKDPVNFVHLDMIVSTDADQTAIGSGELVRSWKMDGRNFFHYKTGTPIPFRFAFSSGRYRVQRAKFNDISIEVFYDPAHYQNVERLITNTQQTLKYASGNFSPYPFKSIRFAEISDFATGFAATAYPSVIYMKEGMGFNADLRKNDEQDVINQLAGHELSHVWWGSAQLSPDQREGHSLMTETLAQYTELMLYRQAHGAERALELVKVHLDLYLAARGYQPEVPLYRAGFESPHLVYNKGMVAMHQLEQLAGERAVNKALAYFFTKYRYPNSPPTSPDLLEAFRLFTPASMHGKIDELFKSIITYESKLNTAILRATGSGEVELKFSGELRKFNTVDNGRKIQLKADSVLDIGVKMKTGVSQVFRVEVKGDRFEGKVLLNEKPVSVTLDPFIRNLDDFPADNTKTFSDN